MLVRVQIENLVIVSEATFEPGPGLTSVTGETGAGKTLLATAIGLLFGSDAAASHVGAGTGDAWVEGEFDVDDSFWNDPTVATLAELRPDATTPLILARKVSHSGRSRALAWGRTIAKSDLEAAGQLLVATAGQHAGRRLLMPAYQRNLIDRSGGEAHAGLCTDMATSWGSLEQARAELVRIRQAADDAATHAAQIREDLDRIDAVAPEIDEESTLRAHRDRARHRTELLAHLHAAREVLTADGGSVIDLLGSAAGELQQAARLDESLLPLASGLIELQASTSELASDMHTRVDHLHEDGSSLDDIEDRLAAYDDLKRRYGGTIESVLARWQQLREQVTLIDGSAITVAAAEQVLCDRERAANDHAARLTASRCRIADQIAADVADALAQLGMADSVFRVQVDESPLSRSGADRVEMLLAPSAQLEPRPVTQVASGGELSRIALALHVATGAGEAPTMIFDEIDAGIGGKTAHAIASMLRRLSEHAQVICITHLPQVAARATTNVTITKLDGLTELHRLDGEDDVVDELCRMLGSDSSDESARSHARSLRGPRVTGSTGRSSQSALFAPDV